MYQWMSVSLHGQSEAVFPDLGYDMSSVRNCCCCSPDVISQGNQWWGPDNREKNEFSLVLRASVGKSHKRER